MVALDVGRDRQPQQAALALRGDARHRAVHARRADGARAAVGSHPHHPGLVAQRHQRRPVGQHRDAPRHVQAGRDVARWPRHARRQAEGGRRRAGTVPGVEPVAGLESFAVADGVTGSPSGLPCTRSQPVSPISRVSASVAATALGLTGAYTNPSLLDARMIA